VRQPAAQTGSTATEAAASGRLAELYLAYADNAIRLVYLLTGDPSLAEDLVQDAFVKMAGRLRHLRVHYQGG
jgi:DNA-directed RNA polymerase specialized sigma24 family protein